MLPLDEAQTQMIVDMIKRHPKTPFDRLAARLSKILPNPITGDEVKEIAQFCVALQTCFRRS